jgi:hypothetical protein
VAIAFVVAAELNAKNPEGDSEEATSDQAALEPVGPRDSGRVKGGRGGRGRKRNALRAEVRDGPGGAPPDLWSLSLRASRNP